MIVQDESLPLMYTAVSNDTQQPLSRDVIRWFVYISLGLHDAFITVHYTSYITGEFPSQRA